MEGAKAVDSVPETVDKGIGKTGRRAVKLPQRQVHQVGVGTHTIGIQAAVDIFQVAEDEGFQFPVCSDRLEGDVTQEAQFTGLPAQGQCMAIHFIDRTGIEIRGATLAAGLTGGGQFLVVGDRFL